MPRHLSDQAGTLLKVRQFMTWLQNSITTDNGLAGGLYNLVKGYSSVCGLHALQVIVVFSGDTIWEPILETIRQIFGSFYRDRLEIGTCPPN